MKYEIVKLRFKTAVHFGNGRLDDAEMTLPTHSLFSALCQEALKLAGEKDIHSLVNAVNEDKLAISDALPFIGETFYLPKPLLQIESSRDEEDQSAKKKFKRLKYIPLIRFGEYCRGSFKAEDAEKEADSFQPGKSGLRTRLADTGRCEQGDPYQVGVFQFNDGTVPYEGCSPDIRDNPELRRAGLYVLMGGEEIWLEKIKGLFRSLGYSGIGGKRSSGLGRFEPEFVAADAFAPLLDLSGKERVMSLSACMAAELCDELLAGAGYVLKRASGFVASANYAETQQRRRDFYDFAAGSVFKQPFKGLVQDVKGNGSHPVWHYAVPLWVGVDA